MKPSTIAVLLTLCSWPVAPRAQEHAAPTTTVHGLEIDWGGLRKKTLMVAFFSMRMQGLADCLQSYQEVYDERQRANLEVIGVCIDKGSRHGLRAYLDEHGYTFPVVVDDKQAMQAAYQPKAIPQAYFFAEGGKYIGDLPGFPEEGSPTPSAFYTNLLRRAIGLELRLENDPATTPWPEIPSFTIPATEISSENLRGTNYVLAFVAANCDKCRAQLDFFRSLDQEFSSEGLEFVVILVSDEIDLEAFRKERKLPFAVHGDRGGNLRQTLRYRGFVPDTLIVDAAGKIRYRHTTFDEEQPPLYRMELRRLLGLSNPPILKRSGPSGVRRCMVCHEEEYFDWRATGHSSAMRSLQAIGAANKPDCVRCHVVGWDQPGGFNAKTNNRALLLGDVQCESCHQAGGPHLNVSGVPHSVNAKTCASCHDREHSLAFDFEKFAPLIDHSTDLLTLTSEQRQTLSELRALQRQALLEPDGAYVGATTCQECHQAQYHNWQDSAHAKAMHRLPESQQTDADCLRCHTTGFERQWHTQSPTTGVQCEACHGPGNRHLNAATPAQRRETIIGLGERCPECVIRQLCTSCHDADNDPDFDLAVALLKAQGLCKKPQGQK